VEVLNCRQQESVDSLALCAGDDGGDDGAKDLDGDDDAGSDADGVGTGLLGVVQLDAGNVVIEVVGVVVVVVVLGLEEGPLEAESGRAGFVW